MDSLVKAKLDLEREKIIEKIKSWLREAEIPFEQSLDPEIDPKDIVIKVTGKKEATEEPTLHYFIVLPHDTDSLSISTYLRFKESDNIGFKLLLPRDKLKFDNMLRIPLLTLNLGYMWIPNLQDFESLEMHKQIFFDGFNKHIFFDTVSAVIHGYEIALAKYLEFLDSVSHERNRDNDSSTMR